MLPAALLCVDAADGPVFLFARSDSHWPLCQVEASVARCGSWPWTSSPRSLARPPVCLWPGLPVGSSFPVPSRRSSFHWPTAHWIVKAQEGGQGRR